MKRIILILFLLIAAVSTRVTAQVLRAFTPRYYNASVKGNITFVANNIITSSGVNTSEAPPGGTAVNNGNTGANIDISGTTLIAYGSSWKYYSTNAAPAGSWKTWAIMMRPGHPAMGNWDMETGMKPLVFHPGEEAHSVHQPVINILPVIFVRQFQSLIPPCMVLSGLM